MPRPLLFTNARRINRPEEIPIAPPEVEKRAWSWGWLIPAGVLVVAAMALRLARRMTA